MVVHPVICLQHFRILDLMFRHESDHITSGHLCINTLLNDSTTFQFAEYTCDEPVVRLKIFLNAAGIFFGRQIDDYTAIITRFLVEGVSPVFIKITGSCDFGFCLRREASSL